MKSCNDKENCINDNNGSVMLTVIIAFLFISILVAIIMPLTVMNFRMKAMERRTKDEFYYVEKSLNDIYSGIGKECSQELGKVYSNTLANSYEFTDDTLAYERFCYSYVSGLKDLFYNSDNQSDYLKDKFNKYLTDSSKSRAVVNNDANINKIKVSFIKKDGTKVCVPNSGDYKDYKKIVIEDIYVSSIAGSEYKSSITTDIVIQIPEISFFKINENELDYALVGCEGIVLNGKADIIGNVYGGVNKSNHKGGIKVTNDGGLAPEVSFTSNYVVSAGDITLNDGSLKVEKGHNTYDNEIWDENIVIGSKNTLKDKESTIEISGSIYALNDLQIEGKDKTVTLKGNYYGYGDEDNTFLKPQEGELKSIEKDEEGNVKYYDNTLRSQSSSIIVNATESTVDISGLKNLVLLGQAYIDHNSKFDNEDSDNTSRIANVSEAKLSMDATGMGATMKASQEILLVPEQFINSPNPMRMDTINKEFDVDTTGLNKWVQDNFGTAVKLSLEPVRTVKFQKNGKVYAYCYMSFDDTNPGDAEKYRNAYIQAILNCDLRDKSSNTEPTLQMMKKRIIAAAESQNSEIITEGISNIYAKNAGIVSFEYGFEKNDDGSYKLDADGNKIKNERFTPLNPLNEHDIKIANNATDVAGYANMVGGMNKKYQNLITYLDYNSDFKNSVTDDDYDDPDYPFGRLWWIEGINADAKGNTEASSIKDLGNCRVIINGDSTLNISSCIDENIPKDGGYCKLIVISTGNVVVDTDIKMKGFIFSKGTVTVDVGDGESLEIVSDLSVVQKRISSEITELKNNMPENPNDNEIEDAYKSGYLTRYLLKTNFDNNHKLVKYCNNTVVKGNRRYNISQKEVTDSSMVVNSDYTSFVQFDRWRKTGAGGQ